MRSVIVGRTEARRKEAPRSGASALERGLQHFRASQLYEAIFGTAQAWLEAFLREQLALTPKAATQAASALLARVLYPRFLRTLFGVEAASTHRHAKLDLRPFRSAVAELVPKARS